MSAYDLADEFKNRNWDEVDCVLWCEKSANMLRQQADRIAELEGEVSHLKHINKNWSISEGLALQRIAELEKTMGERLNDLNTRQVEDERTSLVSTPPYAYAVIQGEDGKENVSLQFDHPEMCGQQYKQVIPLFTTPQNQADRIAELEKDLALKTRDRDVFRDFTLAYEERIEELEKDLKKVQWALAQHVDILGEMGWHQVNKNGYTAPQTKSLPNDEIREIGDECVLKNNGILNWIDFAKAIEERHGIK